MSHAAALLTGTAEGRTAYIDADLRDPEKIIRAPPARWTLASPSRSCCWESWVTSPTTARPARSCGACLTRCQAGSHLVLSDGTSAVSGRDVEAAIDDYNETGAVPYCLRTPGQLARFFDGLDLVEPGLVSCTRWRPPVSSLGGSGPAESDQFCGWDEATEPGAHHTAASRSPRWRKTHGGWIKCC